MMNQLNIGQTATVAFHVAYASSLRGCEVASWKRTPLIVSPMLSSQFE